MSCFCVEPNPPINLRATSATEEGLTVQWDPPLDSAVDDYKYVLTKVGEATPHDQGKVQSSQTLKTWLGLHPGSSYNVNLFVITYNIESEAASLDVVLGKKYLLTQLY